LLGPAVLGNVFRTTLKEYNNLDRYVSHKAVYAACFNMSDVASASGEHTDSAEQSSGLMLVAVGGTSSPDI